MKSQPRPLPAERVRVRAAWIALAAGAAILAAKFAAWRMTGSQTIFSDAMESIVNVAAAAIALFAVSFAAQPADADHPYGHGKIEYLTAGFEGGLIAFAGAAIMYEAGAALLAGAAPRELDVGIAVTAAAGVANLLLGMFLLRVGRKHASPALAADGKHVLSDSWTSAGAVTGLVLVRLTGEAWIDAATALVFAAVLLWTGVRLVRHAARGLLDEADPEAIEEVCEALERHREPGVIEVHDLRAITVGAARHVDLHVVVPEYWRVDQAHDAMDRYHARVAAANPAFDLQFHVDPCERAYCARCDVADCPVRTAPLRQRRPITAATALRGPEPEAAAQLPAHPDPRGG
ncbi:MAG: Ferrous-iron efflux pump FieF [Planctomycetes bacterium]|nr:Ferrous-iron efflux pump FieF [Planctomycetota bacterium]